MPEPIALFPDDARLAHACLQGDALALNRFETTCVTPLLPFIARLDNNPAFIAEVCQRLRVKLLTGKPPALTTWRGQGPLHSFVRVVASRLAVDVLRERTTVPAQLFEPDLITSDLEREALQRRYGPRLHEALRVAFDSLSARERAVLKLHALDKAGIDRIADVHQVHRSTAARWLDSIRSALRERTLAALDFDDAESIVRVLLSKAAVSLERHLTPEV